MYGIYLRPLEEISQCAAADYSRRELMEQRNSIATERGNGAATGFVRAASALFTWAVDHDWIAISPCHRIKRLKQGEWRAWLPAEADRAAASLPEHFRRVLILARYTGQRRGDLCAMKWSAFNGQTLIVKQEKTGEEVIIPCLPQLQAELIAWRRDATAVTILTNSHGQPWKPDQLSRSFAEALVRIGLPSGLNVHGLRKLFAAESANAGGTEKEIAAITGHRTLAMVQHYTKSADKTLLAEAMVLKLTKNTNRK